MSSVSKSTRQINLTCRSLQPPMGGPSRPEGLILAVADFACQLLLNLGAFAKRTARSQDWPSNTDRNRNVLIVNWVYSKPN